MPTREPLRVTLTRTVAIALVAGAPLARWLGGIALWPAASALMLWPSLGGHWLELWFLNWLRPRLASSRGVQIAARIAVWFVGGVGFALAMHLTAVAVFGLPLTRWVTWWAAGFGFVAIELVVHLARQLRGRPNFYNGQG